MNETSVWGWNHTSARTVYSLMITVYLKRTVQTILIYSQPPGAQEQIASRSGFLAVGSPSEED